MFLTISLVIFFLTLCILFIPNSIVIKLNFKTQDIINIERLKGFENLLHIKLFGIFNVYTKQFFIKNNESKNSSDNSNKEKEGIPDVVKKILKKAKIDKFVLSLGFNLDNPVANSYINASLNTILCLYINSNQEKFNLKNLYYQTYISNDLIFLNFESIIKINLIDTIKVILKEKINKTKEKINNNKIKNKEKERYV